MKNIFWSVVAMALLAVNAFGSGHISAIWDYNPIDGLIGVSGDYQTEFEDGDFEVDAQLQSGDIVVGDAHVAIAFNVGPVQVKPFAEANTIKTEDWGHTLDGGAKLNVPIGDTGVDVALGMFARNSKAFIPLQHGTRNPVTGEVKWEDATLLNFENLGLLNALFETQFEWKRLNVGLMGIFDVSNQKFHQLITKVSTSWQLTQRLQFSVRAEHIAQAGATGGQQVDISFATGYKF